MVRHQCQTLYHWITPEKQTPTKKIIFCQTDQSKYYTLGTDFSRIEQVVAENHSPNGDRRKRAFELQKARIYLSKRSLEYSIGFAPLTLLGRN